jgi:DNA (cytosine-5)-methyltransferase 1
MNSIELFAGAGGLGLGVSRAGFKHDLVVEWDADACDTMRKNFGDKRKDEFWPVFQGDVRRADFKTLEGKIDFVSGGPPCQPFSIGGKHQGYKDRRDMFPEAARVVRIVRPKAFLFENVGGLLRESFAKYFQYILLQLKYPEVGKKDGEEWIHHLTRLEKYHTSAKTKGLHYNVLFRRVNAADYGVPQKRQRVIIVGFRSDISCDWGFPHGTHSELALLKSKFISGEYWDKHRVPKAKRQTTSSAMKARLEKEGLFPEEKSPWRTVRDAISDLPNPQATGATNILNHKYQSGAKIYPGHAGSYIDEPAKTLKAGGHGVPGGENMLRNPDGSVRYFTIREAARLQTFPDWFAFASSWSESMRQIGNAVPVRLADIMANSIASKLKSATN